MVPLGIRLPDHVVALSAGVSPLKFHAVSTTSTEPLLAVSAV